MVAADSTCVVGYVTNADHVKTVLEKYHTLSGTRFILRDRKPPRVFGSRPYEIGQVTVEYRTKRDTMKDSLPIVPFTGIPHRVLPGFESHECQRGPERHAGQKRRYHETLERVSQVKVIRPYVM